MRITEVIDSLAIGGAERMMVDLTLNLAARGHSLDVVCLRQPGDLGRPLEAAGIRVTALQKPDGPDLSTLRSLSAHLRRNRTELVHTHNPLVHHYGLLAGRMAGTAVVNTIHGLDNLEDGTGSHNFLYGLSCRMTDHVVAVCKMAYETFRAGRVIPGRRLEMISNGIHLERFLNSGPRARRSEFTIGVVGRLVPVKDHATLLRAMKLVISHQPGCRLEILGDGPARNELESLAAELGIQEHVVFRGFDTNVAGFLQELDLFVICSVSEALPLTLLEAMAAGLPVVGTEVGGIPDLIRDGACGWLCPPSDPVKLSEAILEAHASPARSEYGRRGQAFVNLEHSVETMTDRYERLFQNLLSHRSNGTSKTKVVTVEGGRRA